MKQVFLTGRGEIEVIEVPVPGRLPGAVLVQVACSVISAGTEGASVARHGGWLGVIEKAMRSRDRVQQVWDMARAQGLARTWEAVQRKLSDSIAIGYSCAGQVIEVADRAASEAALPCRPGDRVACMGAGYATHAEYTVVPYNLVARIPEGVGYDEAAFSALACVAMQGIRRLELEPGAWVGVLGLGLIGQIAAQLLPAMGYRGAGIDLDPRRAARARELAGIVAWGADEADGVMRVQELTDGHGLDGVVVCAASQSSAAINLAFDMCRVRGRVSLVGDVGLELDRARMYRKEIDLRMSCSYGPGRYDEAYEAGGQDYPLAYVRWTEGRNLEYVLDLLAAGRLRLAPLISHRVPVERAPEGYARIVQRDSDTYGVLIDYGLPQGEPQPLPREAFTVRRPVPAPRPPARGAAEVVRLGIVGSGGFARATHLPNLARLRDRFRVVAVATRSGATAALAARRFNVPLATSDYRVLLDDPAIDAVLIATRHREHARLVLEALDAGKHVFVEKPMCLTVREGQEIVARAREGGRIVRVGFNRRFAPYLVALRQALGTQGLRTLLCRVNVGSLAEDWSNTPAEGGRLLGEGVHFFDFCNWVMGQEPEAVSAISIGEAAQTNPNLVVQVRYPDGSTAQVLYTSLGDPKAGKEYFEAFGNGRAVRVDDYRRFEAYGARVTLARGARGDKGHLAELKEFAAAVRGQAYPIAGADARSGLIATWMALAAHDSAVRDAPVRCDI